MADNGRGKGATGTGMRVQLLQKVRRQAARAVETLLEGDAGRNASASIRSIIYAPSVVAKKATLALTCQTLKYLPVLKEVLASTDLLNGKKKIPVELIYVLVCDLLFGQDVAPSGDVEKHVLTRKSALRAALARLLVKKNVSGAEELLPLEVQNPGPVMPRYVRVNTLKLTVAEAIANLRLTVSKVEQDDLVANLLVLPAGTDLHKHPLVLQGSLLLQTQTRTESYNSANPKVPKTRYADLKARGNPYGKASCLPAQALSPSPDWEVLDACAAPGNKTVHLASIMKGHGKVIACEVNEIRLQRLLETVHLAGASNVDVRHQDFLTIDPTRREFANVRAVLLDPSCSGSGTTVQRLDYLLPSAATDRKDDDTERHRVEQLAQFQQAALHHALAFPALERVVYSTCSIHQRENEDVVQAVLPRAKLHGFELVTPFPSWPHRGLPVFEGAHHLLRTDASRDNMDGFFVAMFARKSNSSKSVQIAADDQHQDTSIEQDARSSLHRRRKLKRKRKKERLALEIQAS